MRLSALAVSLALAGCTRPTDRVVVYCAQDPEYAEGTFAAFTAETGLVVARKFDTEANKSVSLVEELRREAGRPRADLHWNNEPLGTVRLRRAGLIERYYAFAARARVLVVNTQLVPEADRPKSVFDLAEPRWKGQVAIAKPLFGTTATHAACLFEAVGEEKATDFFRRLKANDVQVVPGNKQVATGVAAGRFAVGVTDTDDAVLEVLAGKPVAIVFPDTDGVGTLFLPNTVAVVTRAPNPTGAGRLYEYLQRPETETRLAEGGGYQFPMTAGVSANLPAGLQPGLTAKRMVVDFERVADRWETTQAVLRELFAR
jgi:iron(III) transport system substrate-binding protein